MTTLLALTSIATVAMAAPIQGDAEIIKLALPKTAKLNTAVSGTVTVVIPAGWHAYQNPPMDKYQTPVTVSSKDKNVVLKAAKYPKGMIIDSFDGQAAVYEGTIKIPISVVFKKAGKQTVTLNVLYQQCDDKSCMPPKFVKPTAVVVVK